MYQSSPVLYKFHENINVNVGQPFPQNNPLAIHLSSLGFFYIIIIGCTFSYYFAAHLGKQLLNLGWPTKIFSCPRTWATVKYKSWSSSVGNDTNGPFEGFDHHF